LEPNTDFYKLHLRGQLVLPEDDEQVAMYELCRARTADDYRHYEISNFARPGRECQHNLAYWRGEAYAGYGPGAVGAMETPAGRVRTTRWKHPARYIAAEDTIQERETLSARDLENERIMLGLRLAEGVALPPSKEVDALIARGWARHEGGRLRLTPEGQHFCSEVALRLMDC
jgi:oxygen-independent coproporphyrinogen-3 oxidase